MRERIAFLLIVLSLSVYAGGQEGTVVKRARVAG
jgi:hypothetical protein